MADQVTVSTFLELKDNMSNGLRRLEGLLKGIESAAGGAKAALEAFNKTANQGVAGIRQQRVAQTESHKAALRSHFAKERMAIKQQQNAAKATDFAFKQEQKRRAVVERSALQEIRDTGRVFAQRERLAQSTARSEDRLRDSSVRQAARANAAMQQTERRRHRAALNSMLTLKESSSRIGHMLSGLLGALAIGTAVKQIFDLGESYENLMMRIAGTLQAFRMTPTFGIAQKQAAKVYSFLHEQAAKLPGEVEDYANVFAAALPKAIASGMTDIKAIADFTSRYTAVAMANMVDSAQAGRDLFEMLSGRARSDVKTFRVLQEHIGMTASEFNKLSIAARRSKIDDALQNYNELIAAFGDTFNAKFSTMVSQAKELVRLGTQPLFGAAKTVLDKINTYLKDNHDRLVAMGNYISSRLARYFGDIDKLAVTLGDHLDDVYDATKAAIELWIAATTIGALTNLVVLAQRLRDAFIAIEATGVLGGLAKFGGFAPRALGALGVAGAGAATYLYSKTAAAAELEPAQAEMLKQRQQYFAAMRPFEESYKKAIGYTGETVEGLQDSIMGQFANYEADLARLYSRTMTHPGKFIPGGEFDPRNVLAFAESLGYDPERIAQLGGFTPGAGVKAPETLQKVPKERTHTINDFRFSRFDIKQEFAEGFDPDRIAVAFASDLARLGEFKVQSMNAPTYTAAAQ